MTEKTTISKNTIMIALTVLIAAILYNPILGGPGESDDPLVSLSYLQTVTRFGEIEMRKNQEFPIESGSTFILVDGNAELRGVGDYNLLDLTSGKSQKRAKNVSESHLYVVTGGSDVMLTARGDVTILVNGGDANPSRHGMK